MPTPSAWRRRVACGVCASLLAVSLAAYADYKDSYGKGLEAYKAGRYADARQLLLAAIAEHPEPAARVRLYGTRFEPYLPQHYLGLISAAQGDCAGAQAAWAMAENAQTVAQVGDAANEEKSAAAKCGSVAIAQKPSAPAPPPAAAPKANESSVAQKTAPPPASTPESPKAPAPKPDADKNVASTGPATPSRPSEPEVKPAVERPAEKPAAPSEKVGPPDQLIATFENFLNGNLREVARINPDNYADARVRFHAYLVRSGARYTLAQLGDQSQFEAARADARQAHALNANAAPDAVLFSPHFRSFYAENR
ncbi:MAG: hypothetical protein E6K53_11800 [Gammaproteobacteria bacterium]|nr:MAG: hypothetical protein E6K53_11800 [Gammaproteobacteria bacterium]